MKRKPMLTGLGAFFGMLILILDGKTALEGAQTGIELCIKTVIPSLFPFFLLSILLTSSLSGFSLPFLKPLRKLCRLGAGTESILISGFLGGYPVGAQCVASAYQAGQISLQEAQRMLAFCSNAGPAFLFGMVAFLFPESWMAWSLWGTHVASAILVSVCIPGQAQDCAASQREHITLPEALGTAIRVMALVCGWVILFRVVIAFLNRWILWIVPVQWQVLLTGLLELSNGCCALPLICDVRMRYLVCSAMLSLGGICVTMQTASVTAGLSLRLYFLGKGLQTVFSLLISLFILRGFGAGAFGVILIVFLFSWKNQKKSSNFRPIRV